MKMLSDNQIRIYLKWTKSKNKSHNNKAKSRLRKDFNKYANKRIEIMKSKLHKLTLIREANI